MNLAQFQAITLSLMVAAAAVVLALPWAVAAGWVLARCRFPGKTAFDTLVNLPLVLPPVVTGYLLLLLLGRNSWLGSWLEQTFGIALVFDWKGAAIASAVVAFPLLVRSIRLAVDSVDRRLESVARTLGASPWDTFWSVTLPLSRKGIVAGCLLAFARSLGEFGATIMIAGNIAGETQTIPLFIYEQLQTPGGENQILIVLLFSILLSAVALAISGRLESHNRSGET